MDAAASSAQRKLRREEIGMNWEGQVRPVPGDANDALLKALRHPFAGCY
jgi:hypothetical protein